MEPDVVLLANVRDGVDGVEGAIDGGARRAVDEEGQVTLALVPNNQLLQLLGNHTAPAQKQTDRCDSEKNDTIFYGNPFK